MNDIPHMQTRFDPNGGLVHFGSDDKLFVQFSKRATLDGNQTREKNYAVYVQTVFVRIQQPGERDYLERPASAEDIARFPRQYTAFMAGQSQEEDGTPLSILFPVNPEIVENLRYAKITTVERLAGLNDTAMQNLGLGGREFVDRAKQFLKASEKGKGFHELEKRIQAVEADTQRKDKLINDLQVALAAAEDKLKLRAA